MESRASLLLSEELLAAFEERLARVGAPCVSAFRPGLSEDEMDALTAPLGLRLPEEARQWWGWHDGIPVAELERPIDGQVAPQRHHYALSEAVEQYRIGRAEAAYLAKMQPPASDRVPELRNPDYWWAPSWFPLTLSFGWVVLDCDVGKGEPSPLRLLDFAWLNEEVHVPRAASLGQLVEWWIEAMDTGAHVYDARRGRWDVDPDRLVPGLARAGL